MYGLAVIAFVTTLNICQISMRWEYKKRYYILILSVYAMTLWMK